MRRTGGVVVVPCSGTGSSYGTVSREAAYEVVDDLRPDEARLVALSLLMLGGDEAREAVACCPVVTVDGCHVACAQKMVEAQGGAVARAFSVPEVNRRYRGLLPRGVAELNESGLLLASALADEIAAAVDALANEREHDHG